MPTKTKSSSRAKALEQKQAPDEQYVRVRLKALEIPPIKDGIVIGISAPIGADAMLRTLKLISHERFMHFSISDDIISDIIIRESVLRKLRENKLKEFVLGRVKPLMCDNELLMLDMDIEVVVEDTLYTQRH